MEPEEDPSIDVSGVHSIFRDGYLVTMDRVIAPPPARLPWRRVANDRWELHRFVLTRVSAGHFYLTWPDGSTEGDKDHVSAAVRENWSFGV
jgi:hypothetical protein